MWCMYKDLGKCDLANSVEEIQSVSHALTRLNTTASPPNLLAETWVAGEAVRHRVAGRIGMGTWLEKGQHICMYVIW